MPDSYAPKKGSGEHPAVKAYHAKLESVREHQLVELAELNERIDRLATLPAAERPTEPAPPDSTNAALVVEVPESNPSLEGPPAPESNHEP